VNDLTTIDGVNYGPLAVLIGIWKGDKGVGRAPEPGGEERSPYYEIITFEAGDDVTNGEEQILAVAVVTGGKLGQPQSLEQELVFEVAAQTGSMELGIVQAPFMFNKAKTTAFTHTLTVTGDTMRHSETTVLDIYQKKSYDHKDVNTLQRQA
jgi:hypothetical protein